MATLLAIGHRTGAVPGAGGARLDRRLAALSALSDRDGELVACGALEQKFWETFTAAIGLAAEFVDDRRDPAATRSAVAKIIASRDANEWKPVPAQADCCVTIVATLEQALRDPHFIERGLFEHKVSGASGATIPALPVPIDPAFRARQKTKPLPALGADDKLATVAARASGAAAKRKARRPRARRRGAAGRSGR